MTYVSHRNLEREVDRSEHLSEEDPPTCQSCEEAKGASCNLQSLCHLFVSLRCVPISTGQYNESEKQSEEDGYEDKIGPQGANEVDQTQKAHEEEKEAYVTTD